MPRDFNSINKNVVSLGIVSFFTDMASAMVTPLIPILVVHILNNDIQTLSQIVALATFVSYAFRLVFGYLGDKYQLNKLFVVIGYALSAITKPWYSAATSWQMVAGLQTGERLGKAIRSASKDQLISAYAKQNESGKTFGFHKMMDIAGELFGAILIFAVLYVYGDDESIIRQIFLWTLLPGIIAVLVVIFLVKDAPNNKVRKTYAWVSSDSRLLVLISLYLAFSLFILSPSFYVIKATDIGLPIAIIPVLFIVLSLTQTLSSYYIGIKIDVMGAANMLLIAFGFGVVTLLSLYAEMIWVAFIFLGLFTVASFNAMRSYISHHATNKATLFGILYAGSAIATSLGALLTGYLWEKFSVNTALLIAIGGTLLVTLSLFGYRAKLIH